MRAVRTILLTLLLLVVVGLVGGYWYERPLLLTGTGYAAHNACAVREVADRDDPETDLPPNPLVPVLSADTEGDRTDGTVLGLLSKQTAWHTPGYGCALGERAPKLPPVTEVDPTDNPFSATPTPEMAPDIEAAVSTAFGDDLSGPRRAALGTRAVLVVKGGELVAERYAPGFDADTRQLGWSMTKSMAALLTGRLVQEGVVSLDDDGLRPEWTDGRAEITVRQLLQMTSGLGWDETYALGSEVTRMLYLEADMPAYVAAQPLAHEPGSYLQYSTGSSTLLCDVLADKAEQAGMAGGADLPRRELLAPLGMESAVLETDAEAQPVCGSYLWATPRDWAALGAFALADGVWGGERLLPEGWMQQAATPVDTEVERGSEGYGSGWWANVDTTGAVLDDRLPADAYSAEGHDGQRIVVVPSEDVVVVRLGFAPEMNSDPSVAALTSAVIDAG